MTQNEHEKLAQALAGIGQDETLRNRFLAFDEESGLLTCEAGVSFAEIIHQLEDSRLLSELDAELGQVHELRQRQPCAGGSRLPKPRSPAW